MPRFHLRMLVALLAVFALVVAACGDDDDDDAAAESATTSQSDDGSDEPEPADGEPIRIGAVLSVTGPAGSLGEQQRDALELQVDKINADGGVDGRPVELEVRDDESAPDRGVEQMRALLAEFDPHAVIGPTIGAVCGATRPITDDAEVVAYCMSAAPIQYPAPFFFSANSELSRLAGDLVVHWMLDNGYGSIGCVASDDTSGQNYLSAIQGSAIEGSAAGAAGLEVSSETFNLNDVDISAQLTRLRDQDPDALYACTTGAGLVTILQGMQQLGFDVPIFVGSGSATLAIANTVKDILPTAGAFTGGELIQVPTDLDLSDPQQAAIADFADEFEAEFGYAPDYFAAQAVDILTMLAEEIAATGEDDPDAAAIAAELEDREPYVGLHLTYDFTADNHRGTGLSGVITRYMPDGTFSLVDIYEDVPEYSQR